MKLSTRVAQLIDDCEINLDSPVEDIIYRLMELDPWIAEHDNFDIDYVVCEFVWAHETAKSGPY